MEAENVLGLPMPVKGTVACFTRRAQDGGLFKKTGGRIEFGIERETGRRWL